MYFVFKLLRSFILLTIARKKHFFFVFSFILTFHLYRTPCLYEMQMSGNRSLSNTIVLFKIIGRVNIFLNNFTISGAILRIFSYIVEIEIKAEWRLENEKEKIQLLRFCIYVQKTHINWISYLSPTWKCKFPGLYGLFWRVIERYMPMVDLSQKNEQIPTIEFFRV